MRLHVRSWGQGERTAALVHGMTSDSESWCRVGPALAERGYRVLAPDLRGHGLSRRGDYSVEAWAGDLAESLPSGLDLVLGHSLGAAVVGAALERLAPLRAVYEDPAWTIPFFVHEPLIEAMAAEAAWTEAEVRALNPRWSDQDVAAKLAGSPRWDPATGPGFFTGDDLDWTPEPVVPSLLMLADPSASVSPGDAQHLGQRGFEVVVVPGAGHSIHRDDLGGFLAALDGWI